MQKVCGIRRLAGIGKAAVTDAAHNAGLRGNSGKNPERVAGEDAGAPRSY
jgi:hypothetical protein